MSKRYILNGTIEFSPVSRQLISCKNNELVITLNAPVSRCLELLVERRDSLVPQKDFYPYVWGDQGGSVAVSTLYQNIALLRKALKIFAERGDKIIQTIPKEGFSLAADVTVQEFDSESDEASALCKPLEGKHSVVLAEHIAEIVPEISDLPGTPKQGGRSRRRLFVIPAVLLVLFVILILQTVKWGLPSTSDYYSEYEGIAKLKGCHILANYMIGDMNWAKEFISDNNIDCIKMPYAYVTKFPYSSHISLLSCDRALHDNTPPKCAAYNLLAGDK